MKIMREHNELYPIDFILEKEKGETPNHWSYRKLFLEQYRSQICISKINALSQMYANIEEMGCAYPKKIMSKIKSMTKDFQQIKVQKKLIQFIKADDYSNNKLQNNVDSISRDHLNNKNNVRKRRFGCTEPTNKSAIKSAEPLANSSVRKEHVVNKKYKDNPQTKNTSGNGKQSTSKGGNAKDLIVDLSDLDDPLRDLDIGLFAIRLYEENLPVPVDVDEAAVECGTHDAANSSIAPEKDREKLAAAWRARVVRDTFNFCGVPFSLDVKRSGPESYECRAHFAGRYEYAADSPASKDAAKRTVFRVLFDSVVGGRRALLVRRQPERCLNPAYFETDHVVPNTQEYIGSSKRSDDVDLISTGVVSTSNTGIGTNQIGASSSEVNSGDGVDGDSFAVRLMKKFGWRSGQGLGCDAQGRLQPVEAVEVRHRRGLGADADADDDSTSVRRIHEFLDRYAADSASTDDLVFSSEFALAQRRSVHAHCSDRRRRLASTVKSRSFGGGEKRYLVVTKCLDNYAAVRMAEASEGGRTNRFILYDAKALRTRYPHLFE